MRRIEREDPTRGLVCSRGADQVKFLATKALLTEALDFGRTYVLAGEASPPIQGFYTICMARIHVSQLPEAMRADAPHDLMPVALLAQLARDDRAAKGLGEDLIADALARIVRVSDEVGCAGAMLDANNEDLAQYYEKFGFVRIGSSRAERPKLFLRIKDVRENFGA